MRRAPALAAYVVGAIAIAGVIGGLSLRATAQPAAPPPTPTFDVAALVAAFGDVGPAVHLRDKTIVIRGVVRDRRSDSFGNTYVELGRGLDYEVPIVQCFVADKNATSPAPGTVARFRARLLGESLSVAIQADQCVELAASP